MIMKYNDQVVGNTSSADLASPSGSFSVLNMLSMQTPEHDRNACLTLGRMASLWLLFFLICLGLGYPALNRYDPGTRGGTSDVPVYRNLVEGRGPSRAPDGQGEVLRGENYYRILVPTIARPFYRLARGHVGSWDPALFGLLISNAIFTATTALLLVAIGFHLTFDLPLALLGAALYLLNFCISNLYLVGLIDSGESCFFLFIVWSLLNRRWYLLPLWGILGALAKETFAPLSAVLVFGWWISEVRRENLQLTRLAWLAALGVASLGTVIVTMSSVAGKLVYPWKFAASMHAREAFFPGLMGSIFNHTFWFVFAWLLPLGVVRLRSFPRPWVIGAALAFGAALVLGGYNHAGDNTARALFNIAGPLLSLSAAILIAGPSRLQFARRPDAE